MQYFGEVGPGFGFGIVFELAAAKSPWTEYAMYAGGNFQTGCTIKNIIDDSLIPKSQLPTIFTNEYKFSLDSQMERVYNKRRVSIKSSLCVNPK